MDAQNGRVKNLERQAEEALKQGNEKLARRALQLQVEARATAERAAGTYKAAKVRADNARGKLKVEEERIQGKIRQLGELKAIHAMNDAQRRMQSITDEYNIDGAMNVFDKTAGSIQEQADKLSAMDTIAVSEGEDLDRQLSAISQKTEVDAAHGGPQGAPGRAGTPRGARPPPSRRTRSPPPSRSSRTRSPRCELGQRARLERLRSRPRSGGQPPCAMNCRTAHRFRWYDRRLCPAREGRAGRKRPCPKPSSPAASASTT